MKINIVTAIFLSLLISACATPPKETASEAQPQTIESTQAAEVSTAADAARLSDQLLAMQGESIYFDFDKFNIKPEFHDTIARHADFLMAHEDVIVTLEGNADERGSTEYNLALGNRRANSVKKSLTLLGVPADRIKVISFGEERPRKTCHDESCWQENRRVDFIGRSGS